MNNSDLIQHWSNLANAATTGPWVALRAFGMCQVVTEGVCKSVTDAGRETAAADAEFISKARTAVPAMAAALQAIYALADEWDDPHNLLPPELAYHTRSNVLRRTIDEAMKTQP